MSYSPAAAQVGRIQNRHPTEEEIGSIDDILDLIRETIETIKEFTLDELIFIVGEMRVVVAFEKGNHWAGSSCYGVHTQACVFKLAEIESFMIRLEQRIANMHAVEKTKRRRRRLIQRGWCNLMRVRKFFSCVLHKRGDVEYKQRAADFRIAKGSLIDVCFSAYEDVCFPQST